MPAFSRREIIAQGEIGAYHCMARCVRRAYLCGKDSLSGKNFEHRKDWVRDALKRLASAFAIEISAFAVMDNHLHVILKQRPDLAANWTSEEVIRRWRLVFSSPVKTRAQREALETKIEVEALDSRLVRLRRDRLSDVSWFMRCLCEPIARKANKEDGCKGRFWEGRFRSQALLDDAALLACMAYVDLNPIRSGIAKTPEWSRNTSIYDRICELRQPARKPENARGCWLSPMGPAKTKHANERPVSESRACGLTLQEYMELLDWTGRQIRQGKRGVIPSQLAPIFERMKIQTEGWLQVTQNFGRWFKHAAGSPISMAHHARRTHRHWLQGIGPSKSVFL